MWQQPGGWGQQPWPIQQSAYANMAHDQVDWAALAKQWMQFKDVGEATPRATPLPPPPPPQVQAAVIVPVTQPASNAVAQRSSSWTAKPAANASWSQSTTDNHAWGSSTANDWTMDVDSQGATNSSQGSKQPAPARAFDYNHRTTSKTFDSSFKSLEPPRESVDRPDVTVPPPTSAPAAKINQGYEYNQQHYHEQQHQQFWLEQAQKSLGSVQSSDRLPSQHRPHFHDADVTGPPAVVMDAAKRKTLPAWIREGLEKMEREKARKEEQEKLAKERQEARLLKEAEMKRAEQEAAKTGIPVRSKFEDDDEEEEEADGPEQRKEEDEDKSQPVSGSKRNSVSRSPSPEITYMTAEERQAQLMTRVKLMLTEVLLTVTNEQIESVCRSVYNKCRKQALAAPAKMIGKSNALASLKNTFGGDDSEASDADSHTDREDGDSSDEDVDVERRRYEFKKKQWDRLKRLDEEEKQAMDWFNNPNKKKETHSENNDPSLVLGKSNDREMSDSERADESTNSTSRASKDLKRSESDGGTASNEKLSVVRQSSHSRHKRSSRSRSRERARMSRGDREERDRSRDRKRQRRSRSRERKRSRTRKHKDRSRDRESRRRSRSADYSRYEDEDYERRRDRKRSRSSNRRRSHRSRSRDRKKRRSYSREHRSHRSRSRDRKRSYRHSRSDQRDRSYERARQRSGSVDSTSDSELTSRHEKYSGKSKNKDKRRYSEDLNKKRSERTGSSKGSEKRSSGSRKSRNDSVSPERPSVSSTKRHEKLPAGSSTKSTGSRSRVGERSSRSNSSSSGSSSDSESTSQVTE